MAETVSVIIPTLNAEKTLNALLGAIALQTVKPTEVLVVDSGSTDRTLEICRNYEFVRCLSIRREDFDHGGTRDWALGQTTDDYVLFLTQDALPTGDGYIAAMLSMFADERVAACCGRQIAGEGASQIEKMTRSYNYPDQSHVRGGESIATLGIKAFFLSDACSAYRRTAYDEVGGFLSPILTNEDMQIARSFLEGGYLIAYCADAAVYHAHEYSFAQEFRRNFDIGCFLSGFEKGLPGVRAESEGVRYVRWMLAGLIKAHAWGQCLRFLKLCAAKALGVTLGRRAERMPLKLKRMLSANKAYWGKQKSARMTMDA